MHLARQTGSAAPNLDKAAKEVPRPTFSNVEEADLRILQQVPLRI